MTQLSQLNWINKLMNRQQGSGIGVISTPITENIGKVRFSRGPRDNEYLGLWGKNFFGIDNFYGQWSKNCWKLFDWLSWLIFGSVKKKICFLARYPSNLIFTTYCTTCGKELLSISADIRCDWATASLRATLSYY